MKNFVDRFEEFIDFTGLSAYKLAKELESSDSVISTIRSGKNKPGFDFLSKILRKYEDVNIDYLLTGKGKLIRKTGNTPSEKPSLSAHSDEFKALAHTLKGHNASQNASPTASPVPKKGSKTITYNSKKTGENNLYLTEPGAIYNLGSPKVITINERQEENITFVPVKARAGYLNGYGDPEFISSLPSYRLPGLDNGTFRMFEVDGPSMAPNIISGDRVIGQWLNSLDEIRDNRVHVVVTREDGVIVKRIQNRISQRGKLVIKSDTITHRADFPTYQIDPEQILEIWYCRLKLSSDFSEPSEVYHRIADLESDMTEVKQILASLTK